MNELYDRIGRGYANRRRPDPTVTAAIRRNLGDAATVMNAGAGTGSYEPKDLNVFAVEPSAEMIRQRSDRSNVVRGYAEALPFADDSFDALLAILTIHHWNDKQAGLRECRRVTRERVVIVTWDPDFEGFWLTRQYFPEIQSHDRKNFPPIGLFRDILGDISVTDLPVPGDCKDGFLGSYWRRPGAYVDREIRAGMSTFAKVPDVENRVRELEDDIESGRWARANEAILSLDELDVGYRLITAEL